jgi:hypothetical protein
MPRSIDLESVIDNFDAFDVYQPLVDPDDKIQQMPSACSYLCIFFIVVFFILFDIVLLAFGFYAFACYIVQMIDVIYIYAMLTGAICFVILITELVVFGIIFSVASKRINIIYNTNGSLGIIITLGILPLVFVLTVTIYFTLRLFDLLL